MSSEKERTKWVFPNIPRELAEEIDVVVNKHGNEIRIFSRADFIRVALVEKLEKVRGELKEKKRGA